MNPISADSLNPHVGYGTHGWMAARLVLEPLFDLDENFQPVLALAAEWPTLENGLLDPEGRWVIWRLREGVKWHDGERFDAEDVAFTWDFITGVSPMTQELYKVIDHIDVLDTYTVRLHFGEPSPTWINLFRDTSGVILPAHIFRNYLDNPPHNPLAAVENRKIVGTGPWRVAEVDMRTGDLRFERFEDYWDTGKPYFDAVEYLGGGDSTSLARRLLVNGDADWAHMLEYVDPVELQDMAERSNLGQVVQYPTNQVETLFLNFADPNTEIDGARAEPGTNHPLFSDRRVREAIAHAIDREAIAAVWGLSAEPHYHLLGGPEAFQGAAFPSYDLERARALLVEAGATGGNLLYQTSVNSTRQATQEVVASRLEELGFSVELKSVDAGVFFSSDRMNSDTYEHFYADLQMFTWRTPAPYPLEWAARHLSEEIASQENFWHSENFMRYRNPDYDALWEQATREIDPVRQRDLWQRMMTLLTDDVAAIPLVRRLRVAAVSSRVRGWSFSPWAENPTWNLKSWSPVDEG